MDVEFTGVFEGLELRAMDHPEPGADWRLAY